MEKPDPRYRLLVWSIPVFVALYFCAAGLPALFHFGSGKEKYLLYHFFVFTEVPSREQVSYEAYVTNLKEKAVEPIRMEDAGVFLSDEWRNRPEYARRTEAFGSQLAGNPDGAAESRRMFEELIVTRPISYEIREQRYDPVTRYRTGEVVSERVVGAFTVE